MVKHNNVIPNQHFHKDWQNRVKTWFHQPIQKKIRRTKRQEKAAAIAPRPSAGALRPLVHAPTQKYNSKVRLGRGFTLEELKAAGVNAKFASTVGIAVDSRRTNKSEESLQLNAQRLKDYMARLVVFPKKQSKVTEEQKALRQVSGAVVAAPKAAPAVTFTAVTEEMKKSNAYTSLRNARNDAKLVGIRIKKAKEAKDSAPKDE